MWRFVGGGLIFSLALFVPTSSEAQKKPDDKGGVKGRGTDAQYALLAKQPYISAKVVSVNPGGSSISFAIETGHYEKGNTPNNNGPKNNNNNNVRRPNNYNKNNNNNNNNKNPAQAMQQKMMQQYQQQQKIQQQAIQQYMQQMKAQQNVKLVKDVLEFETPLSEKLVTRKETFGNEYDDKGSIVKPSPEILAKLKGTDKSKPGYAAKFEDIVPGSPVHLYFSPPANADSKPVVKMVVITGEAVAMAGAKDDKKKKK